MGQTIAILHIPCRGCVALDDAMPPLQTENLDMAKKHKVYTY